MKRTLSLNSQERSDSGQSNPLGYKDDGLFLKYILGLIQYYYILLHEKQRGYFKCRFLPG